jgi:hypothetical protein
VIRPGRISSLRERSCEDLPRALHFGAMAVRPTRRVQGMLCVGALPGPPHEQTRRFEPPSGCSSWGALFDVTTDP